MENYLEQPRRGKSLVDPHKAQPQCGAVRRNLRCREEESPPPPQIAKP